MPSVTYDGRSFMIDGRRIWLVSGSVQYTRISREDWPKAIWAAKLAGLNCIETPIFWNRCEPRPGQFEFTGEHDIRHFVELIGRAGMYCIIRPGPFVGSQWDMGGLPPWLLAVKNMKLRTANQPFLEATSRYITALAEQLKDLQVTSPGPGGGGPIILVQNEMHWMGGDDKEALMYLGEIGRYLRESGFNVPAINANNLWQGVEGEIDCWTAPAPDASPAGEHDSDQQLPGDHEAGDMLSMLRQLAAVRPDQPRIVIDFEVGQPAIWGAPPSAAIESPAVIQQRLGQILATGGQFNISPFAGGTNFGFWGGQLAGHHRAYSAAMRTHESPLSESMTPGESYSSLRRLCTFASRFGRIFANLDPGYRPVVIAPTMQAARVEKKGSAAKGEHVAGEKPISLVHTSGPQGSVAFIFAPPLESAGGGEAEKELRSYSLILADGTSIPVSLGADGLAWCLFDAYLGGRARLDYSGLCTFGIVGRILVTFGPAGAEGVLSINGSPLHVQVPKGKAGPVVVQHEEITVIVCNTEQIDTTFLGDDSVYLNCAGLTQNGEPIALPGAKNCVRITADAQQKNVAGVASGEAAYGAVSGAAVSANSASARQQSEKLQLSDWMMASVTDYCDGSSARYASIEGPADLTTLGSPYGYGWYRIRLKSPSTGKSKIAIPMGADRLHVSIEGQSAGLLGFGPGASLDAGISLKKGQGTIVVLAENLGRLAGGTDLGEPKGIFGDIWQVDSIKVPKPVYKSGEPIDVLGFRSPLFEVQPGDTTHPERITWAIQHRKKTAIIASIGPFFGRAILLANDVPVAFIERGGGTRHIIDQEHLRSGTNTIQLAFIAARGGDQDELDQLLAAVAAPGAVSFCEAINPLSAGADWAFAKWEMPRATAYQKFKAGAAKGCPVWWRSHFNPPAASHGLYFEAAGLTKGQIYVNERHLCRYFVATADGKHVAPQHLYHIPAPWIRPDEPNELLVFDEHGGNPSKCRLLYENGRA